jgi:hypothetical protein
LVAQEERGIPLWTTHHVEEARTDGCSGRLVIVLRMAALEPHELPVEYR